MLRYQSSRFFQGLLWYRKSLIQEEPFGSFTEFWDAFKKACPTWPGFRPERCDPSLRDELNFDVDVLMRKLERVIRVCERKNLVDRSGQCRITMDCRLRAYLAVNAVVVMLWAVLLSRDAPKYFLSPLIFCPIAYLTQKTE